MRSQEPAEPFRPATDNKSMDDEEIRCYHNASYIFNRETHEMSPLLFESDTDNDSSQSTEIKCYQDKTVTTPLQTLQTPNNRQVFELLSSLSGLRNEISLQLDTSSQHNQCCSETLLNSSNHRTIVEIKANTNEAHISPSPRVTRSRWWKSKILTRSAKRLHRINEFSEYSESRRGAKKTRAKKDVKKPSVVGGRRSHSKTDSSVAASESTTTSSKPQVVLERLKFPFFQNPHQTDDAFIQPNIAPNIPIIDDADDGFDFLNRRLSSEVQIITEHPPVISISSESTVRNPSPDLFDHFESSSSVSNLCSQNSVDIPNGQTVMRSAELRLSSSSVSTQESTLVPTVIGLSDDDCTPDARQTLLPETENPLNKTHAFEITVNEVFDNVIRIDDSEGSANPTKSISINRIKSPTKRPSSQEVTPKKRPEIRGLLNKTVGAAPSISPAAPLSRSKWLSKPKSTGDVANRTSQRCRRLELWFPSDKSKSKPKSKVGRTRLANLLLSSSEDDDN